MANDIKVLTYIGNDMLRQLKNNLQFVSNIDGQEYCDELKSSPKKGTSMTVRKPTRYSGRSGETFSAEDYKEREVSLTVQTTVGVDLEFTNRELMFNLDYISERVVKPAAETLASLIDTSALLKAVNATPAQIGTPGTIPTALKTYNQARAKMSWESCPQTGHTLLITPDMQVEAVDAGKAFFNPAQSIAEQYKVGMIGTHAGAKVYEVQNLPVHTNGQRGGTPLINGADQDGSSLVTDGWTASVANRVKVGDVFTIADVYAVNPWTGNSTGALRKFTVTADASSDGTGAATISISPAIVLSGPFKNVNSAPADDAALTFDGAASLAYPVGLRFHRDAFMFGTFDQPTPSGKQFAKMFSDPQTGLKIRYIRDWDTATNKQQDRFDVVWAWGVAFPEFACRIAS